jgi:hypothetical protein
MKNISFALTTKQFRDRTKTVTRRLGWKQISPGERLCGIVKGMGLKPGEKVERLGVIEVVTVRKERLNAIDQADVIAEGFPDMSTAEFIAMFCKHMRCDPLIPVNRIEFKYVDGTEVSEVTHD